MRGQGGFHPGKGQQEEGQYGMDENRQRRAHGKDVEMTEEKGPDDGDGPDEVGIQMTVKSFL